MRQSTIHALAAFSVAALLLTTACSPAPLTQPANTGTADTATEEPEFPVSMIVKLQQGGNYIECYADGHLRLSKAAFTDPGVYGITNVSVVINARNASDFVFQNLTKNDIYAGYNTGISNSVGWQPRQSHIDPDAPIGIADKEQAIAHLNAAEDLVKKCTQLFETSAHNETGEKPRPATAKEASDALKNIPGIISAAKILAPTLGH
ncbi:MAG: hypothetical protein AB7H77_08105, partial [Bdellovibrionales bacterium]